MELEGRLQCLASFESRYTMHYYLGNSGRPPKPRGPKELGLRKLGSRLSVDATTEKLYHYCQVSLARDDFHAALVSWAIVA